MKEANEVVKVQLSMNDGGKTILIYNKDRSILQQFPASADVVGKLEDEARSFFAAHYSRETGMLSLGQKLPEQEW